MDLKTDGSDRLGVRAAAELAGAELRGGKLDREGQNGAPGVTSGRVLVVGQARGTRKPLGRSGERIGPRDAAAPSPELCSAAEGSPE